MVLLLLVHIFQDLNTGGQEILLNLKNKVRMEIIYTSYQQNQGDWTP